MSDFGGGPLQLLLEATRKVRVVRYALGVAAVGAATAVTRGFMPDVGLVGMFPVLVGFILVMLVLVLVAAAASSRTTISTPAAFLVWGVCLFVVTFMVFTVTAIAFGWPPVWTRLILPPSAAEAPIVPARREIVEAPKPKTPAVSRDQAGSPGQTPKAAPPAKTTPATTPIAQPDPLSEIKVYYYAKASDGDAIRMSLKRQGIRFEERPTHKTGTVPTNAIACSADVSGDAIRKVFKTLTSAGISVRLIQQVLSPAKSRRIEILTYSAEYTDVSEEGIISQPLSAAQLDTLESCPVQLYNRPAGE